MIIKAEISEAGAEHMAELIQCPVDDARVWVEANPHDASKRTKLLCLETAMPREQAYATLRQMQGDTNQVWPIEPGRIFEVP